MPNEFPALRNKTLDSALPGTVGGDLVRKDAGLGTYAEPATFGRADYRQASTEDFLALLVEEEMPPASKSATFALWLLVGAYLAAAIYVVMVLA